MKKKLITILTVIGDRFKANKGVVSLFAITCLATLVPAAIAALCGASTGPCAIFGACIGTLVHTALAKALDVIGLSFSLTPRPAVVGIAVGTLLALALL